MPPFGSSFLMKIVGAAIVLLSATSANSLQLSCDLPSATDGTLLETLKITITTDGGASVWHRWEPHWFGPAFLKEREISPKVLLHYIPTIKPGHTSVLVVESRDEELKDLTFPPHVYIIDWGKAKLAEVIVPGDPEPLASVYFRWECTRTD
jgi:hypothetical protein